MIDEIIEILEDINDEVDFANATALIDDNEISSLELVTIVEELSEAFNIEIPVTELTAENFNTVEAIASLVKKLK